MKRSYCWMRYWVPLFLLASLATAAGTMESVPAWRTGPVSFEKAMRVPAYYCENQGVAPDPGALTACEIPPPGAIRTVPFLARMESRNMNNSDLDPFLALTHFLRPLTLEGSFSPDRTALAPLHPLPGAVVKNRPRGPGL